MNDSSSLPLPDESNGGNIPPDMHANSSEGSIKNVHSIDSADVNLSVGKSAPEVSQSFPSDDSQDCPQETLEISFDAPMTLSEAAAEAARLLGNAPPDATPDPAADSPAEVTIEALRGSQSEAYAELFPDARADGTSEVKSEYPPERRRRRRAMISAQVRVRTEDVTGGGPDEISTTVDVSRIGFLFLSANPAYQRDMEVLVTFPYSSSPSALQAEQPGRVARVNELGDGRRAVAIAIGIVKQDVVDSGGRVLVTEPACEASHEPLRELSAPEKQPKKHLVLAVDTDALVRNSLKNYLTNEGYEVIAVETAADAREVLNMLTPSIVIAEIEGEGLPGYDICAHVKSTPRLAHIPVVLTTSSAYPSDYSSAHSLGAVVCMAKPYKQERLGHVVRLLAPPPQSVNQAPPPRTADPSRRAGGHRSKRSRQGAAGGSRSFRILPG